MNDNEYKELEDIGHSLMKFYVKKICVKYPWINIALTTIGGAVIAFFIAMACSGCHIQVPYTPPEYTNQTTAVVLVGVQSSYMGENTGTEEDIQYMQELMASVTDNIVTLREIRATKRNIKDAMTKAVQKPLSIIYFSCYAAREKTKVDSWEADKKDEYMVLQDDTIDDNEIWAILSTSTNRVVCIFECPNSETMYRNTVFFDRKLNQVKTSRDANTNDKLNLLVWSACPDDKYSTLTSNTKGHGFTRGIYYYCNTLPNATYSDVWTALEKSDFVGMNSTFYKQYPKKTIVGEGFEDKPVFK